LDPELMRAVNDGSQIASATIGVWASIALGAVAIATFQNHVRPAWYGWFSAACAVLAALSVIGTVDIDNGALFSTLGFFGGFIGFTTVTSILMLVKD
jgi:hypothetical protein